MIFEETEVAKKKKRKKQQGRLIYAIYIYYIYVDRDEGFHTKYQLILT